LTFSAPYGIFKKFFLFFDIKFKGCSELLGLSVKLNPKNKRNVALLESKEIKNALIHALEAMGLRLLKFLNDSDSLCGIVKTLN
jgi:hypothetical protein